MYESSFHQLIFLAPLFVTGLLFVGLGRAGLARHLSTATGPWWVRLWSIHSLFPAFGLLLITSGALFVLGLPRASIGAMAAVPGIFAVALGASAVQVARAGNSRAAAFLAVVALLLLVYFALAVLQWRTAASVLVAVWAGGLLVFGLAKLVRRWHSSSRIQRQSLLQHLTLALGTSCVAATWFLPAHLPSAVPVLLAVSGLCLLVSFALLIITRRETGRWT